MPGPACGIENYVEETLASAFDGFDERHVRAVSRERAFTALQAQESPGGEPGARSLKGRVILDRSFRSRAVPKEASQYPDDVPVVVGVLLGEFGDPLIQVVVEVDLGLDPVLLEKPLGRGPAALTAAEPPARTPVDIDTENGSVESVPDEGLRALGGWHLLPESLRKPLDGQGAGGAVRAGDERLSPGDRATARPRAADSEEQPGIVVVADVRLEEVPFAAVPVPRCDFEGFLTAESLVHRDRKGLWGADLGADADLGDRLPVAVSSGQVCQDLPVPCWRPATRGHAEDRDARQDQKPP